jgi:flagellar basal body-associated protein FliL
MRLAMVLLLLQTIAPPLLASGAAAKKPAQADPKKKTAGHGSSSKEAKKSTGHGKSKAEAKDDEPAISTHVADVEKILSLIAEKEKKHDPRRYVEVDLGEFRVTRPGDDEDEIYVVRFHIYGVLNEQDQPKFDQSAEGRQQRLRDAVLSVVHRAQFDQLMDPALAVVKSELVAAINRIVENDFIRDIAFSTFCMEPS